MSESRDKPNTAHRSGGVNIRGKKVDVGGDVVGRDKNITNQASDLDPVELGHLLSIISELKYKTQVSEEIPQIQKEDLIGLLEDAEQAANESPPEPEEIAEKLNAFQKVLEAIKGVGTAGLGLLPLAAQAIDTVKKLFGI